MPSTNIGKVPVHQLLKPMSVASVYQILHIERIVDYEISPDDLKSEVYSRVLARIVDTSIGDLFVWNSARLASLAHGLLSDVLQERAAQKRGGSGGRKARRRGSERQAIDWVDIDEADEARMLDVDGAQRERQTPEDEVAQYQQRSRLLRVAHETWGTRGTEFVRALLDDASVAEASGKAGISRATGYNWMLTLRKKIAPVLH